MIDNFTGHVAGVCPKCGKPDVQVPEKFDDETIIKCSKCGHQAPHAEFFDSAQE